MLIKCALNVFFSDQIEDNGYLESLANSCMWLTQNRKIRFMNNCYSILSEKVAFLQSLKKTDSWEKKLQWSLLLIPGIGCEFLGCSLKAIVWLHPAIRNKNLAYANLLWKDQKEQSIPLNFHFTSENQESTERSFLNLLPLEIKKKIINLLDISALKAIRLATKSWNLQFTYEELDRQILLQIYPERWHPFIQILQSIPRITLLSKGRGMTMEPIRCLASEDLKGHSIVQGSKNKQPFLAVCYVINDIKGLLVWWKPKFDLAYRPNKNWINANALEDIENVGNALQDSFKDLEQDSFLNCLISLKNKKVYHLENSDNGAFMTINLAVDDKKN